MLVVILLLYIMEKYLTEQNITYKIIGIRKRCKFEMNEMTFIYENGGPYNYHFLIIYVPLKTFEKIYNALEGTIPLIGFVDTMNIYKCEGEYKTFYEILQVLNIIKFGKRCNWIKT